LKEFIKNKLVEIKEICIKHKVLELSLFGSAINAKEEQTPNDLDFAVGFLPAPPDKLADNYFGLLEDLEALFGAPIDLIEVRAIRNPYFLESLKETEIPIYHAA
jgi:hypothetical protein